MLRRAVPLLRLPAAGRRLSSSTGLTTVATTAQGKCALSIDALSGIADTVLLLFTHANPGNELDLVATKLFESDLTNHDYAAAWRRMTDLYVGTQFYTLNPFGYTSDMQGLQAYGEAHMRALTTARSENNLTAVKELETATRDVWSKLIQRSFRIAQPEWPALSVVRRASSDITSHLQSDEVVQQAKEVHRAAKEARLDLGAQVDRVYGSCIVPAFRSAAKANLGTDKRETWITLQAACTLHAQTDPLVAQSMALGFQTISEAAPCLRGVA